MFRSFSLFSAIAYALSCPMANAQFTYSSSGAANIIITGFMGPDSHVVIPEVIDGKTVTGIGGAARFGVGVVSIRVPRTVTYLASGNDNAFSFARNLTNIDVSPDNPNFYSADGVVFWKVNSFPPEIHLAHFPPGRGGHYSPPDGVTSIDAGAFRNAARLESVELPASMRRIGDEAFRDCLNLRNVLLNEGLTSINDSFLGCVSLTNVALPASLSSIGTFTFTECTNLASVTVNPANISFSNLDGLLVNKAQNELIICPPKAKAGAYQPPASVRSLKSYAFRDCSDITSLDLRGVSQIGFAAMAQCARLESVLLSTNLTVLEGSMFMDCPSLGSIVIPPKIEIIPFTIFDGCSSLSNVTLPSGLKSIQNAAFYNCISLRQITLPSTVQGLDSSVFEGCSSLENVILPRSLRSIGNYAFRGCSRFTEFTIDSQNTNFVSIDGVLFDTRGITLMKFPEAKEGNYIVPTGTQIIGVGALHNASKLTSLAVPASVRDLKSAPFFGCKSLARVDIDPANTNLSSIDGVVFNKAQDQLMHCPPGRAGAYAIPASVRNITSGAFSECRVITSVHIPENFHAFDARSFLDCRNLTEFTVDPANTVYEPIDGVLFRRVGPVLLRYPPGKGELYRIPTGTASIEQFAFANSHGLKYVVAPKTLLVINDWAFRGCTNLASVIFEGDAPAFYPLDGGQFEQGVQFYYASGTDGWDFSFHESYPVEWAPRAGLSEAAYNALGFEFPIAGVTNVPVIVEAASSLVNPQWTVIATNIAGGGMPVVDPNAATPARFYRFRSP